MLNYYLARARQAELVSRTERVRQMRGGGPPVRRAARIDPEANVDPPITLRLAAAADSTALASLAGLDSAAIPAAPVLLAEAGGEIRAAVSLLDGAVIADPFHYTLAAQELLHKRAAQLREDPGRSWPRRLLRRGQTATMRPRNPSAAMGGAGTNDHQ